jgi:hypothetical protein
LVFLVPWSTDPDAPPLRWVRSAVQVDASLRQWRAACLALSAEAVFFGIALLAGH